MNDKARSTSSGEDREVGATRLVNGKNHRPASDQIAPYRFLATWALYRKDGTPVMGKSGATIRHVVIFETTEFRRLLREVPALADVPFDMGEL